MAMVKAAGPRGTRHHRDAASGCASACGLVHGPADAGAASLLGRSSLDSVHSRARHLTVTGATRGRPALIELSAPATLDAAGRPVGEVAALFEEWLGVRQANNRITSQRTVDGYRADMARWAALLASPAGGQPWTVGS